MKAHGHTRPKWLALALASILATLLAFAGSPGASAQGKASPNKPEQANCAQGRTLPVSKISVQLWTFSRYIGGTSYVGAPADAPTTGSTTAERLEYVFAFLSDLGIRNIEPYSFHGLTAEEFDALADEYGLKVRSRHMSTNVATWDANLADAKLLGQRWVGSGGFASPGISSYENVLATAETLNALGQASVENGTGKIFGHNHTAEFATKYVDVQGDGTLKSAWQILVENTDRRYVTFQLDVLWATDGGADPVALLRRFGNRIFALHVKDGINVADPANATPVPMGQGEMVFKPILRAAEGHVKYYIYEQDPPFGDPAFDPFASAKAGFDYLDRVRF
jgi:sugar phosphate isomerase/epimerase